MYTTFTHSDIIFHLTSTTVHKRLKTNTLTYYIITTHNIVQRHTHRSLTHFINSTLSIISTVSTPPVLDTVQAAVSPYMLATLCNCHASVNGWVHFVSLPDKHLPVVW